MLMSGNNNHVAGVANQGPVGLLGSAVPGYENSLSDRIIPFSCFRMSATTPIRSANGTWAWNASPARMLQDSAGHLIYCKAQVPISMRSVSGKADLLTGKMEKLSNTRLAATRQRCTPID
jgi:hypothetical protein